MTNQIRVFVDLNGAPTHQPPPSMTEVTSRVLADPGVTFSGGIGRGGQEWAAGSFNFTLRNTDGAYSGPDLLRRPVVLRVTVGAQTADLRCVVTDVTEYRDGVRRLAVSGTDLLGLVGDLETGQTWTEQLAAQQTAARWQLTTGSGDDFGAWPLSEDPLTGMPAGVGGDFSGQDPIYGTLDTCPALSGGGVILEPVAETGFRGLYGPVLQSCPWLWAGWVRVDSAAPQPVDRGDRCVVTVVMKSGHSVGFGFSSQWWGRLERFGTGGGLTYRYPAGTWPLDQWLWITMGVNQTSGYLSLSVVDTSGTVLVDDPRAQYLADGNRVPEWLILGGSEHSSDPHPAAVQIADAVWCTTAPASPGGFVMSPLMRGHVGYPGETVRARMERALTDSRLFVAEWGWGDTPPDGPTLGDAPLTRRPLTDVVQECLDSSGMVIHDLPATANLQDLITDTVTTTLELTAVASPNWVSSLSLMSPDHLDGLVGSVVTIPTKRVMRVSDGVSTTTGMLANAATITTSGPASTQISYEDAGSVGIYGRRAHQPLTSLAQSTDYARSHASWLAHRQALPTQALGLPDLVIDVDGMVADGLETTVTAAARTGTPISVTGILSGGGDYAGVVRGVQWQHTTQGAMRLTLRCQPRRPLPYGKVGTATLDSLVIGW